MASIRREEQIRCVDRVRLRRLSNLLVASTTTQSKQSNIIHSKANISRRKICQKNIKIPILVSYGLTFTLIAISINLQSNAWLKFATAQSISIPTTDFERLIQPCYMAGSDRASLLSGYPSSGAIPSQAGLNAGNYPPLPSGQTNQNAFGSSTIGRQSGGGFGGQQASSSNYYSGSPENNNSPPSGSASYQGANGLGGRSSLGSPPNYPSSPQVFGPNPRRVGDSLTSSFYGDGSSLGQSLPRANTIDNFIALLRKVESANPRLAQNVDELIRALLGRFRMDNYYYDTRSGLPINPGSLADRRNEILSALLVPTQQAGNQAAGYETFLSGHNTIADNALDHDERCSMYFMLSHFIDKSSAMPTLSQLPVPQLSGPLQGQRSPNSQIQAQTIMNGAPTGIIVSGGLNSNYPARSAQSAYSGSSTGPRYPGPSPSFGSPSTSQMNSFGAGISNSQPEYTGNNAYGVNSPLPTGPLGQSAYNNPLSMAARNTPYGGGNLASNRGALGAPPFVDGQAKTRSPDDRIAFEYGVVTLPEQNNAALVLNRVLMGILAATTQPQTIRQLAAQVYSNQANLNLNTPKIDEELDPLFAVTLADLWATISMAKSGRPNDVVLGDQGHWNDSFCPITFTLERSDKIKFTTAELLGGLDGFNLGWLRRRLVRMGRNMKLSEILRIYYSPLGFRPQIPEAGVCNRYAMLSTQSDELLRQAENYARLIQLNLPTSDNVIASSINKLNYFREFTQRAANLYTPTSICQDSAGLSTELYPTSGQDICEISQADVVSVLDSAAQANDDPFMKLTIVKLAQRLGLAARGGSSLTIMTNQIDTTGTAGGERSFNTILRNCTNLAEIGCALTHDSTRNYQGGQVTDPSRLMELFERALVSLDSEYLTRQMMSGYSQSNPSSSSSYSSRPSTYVSTLAGNGLDYGANYMLANTGGPRNTGGAKVILWFNYANGGLRNNPASSGPTNWTPGQTYMSSSSSSRNEDVEYRFYEAKKYLRENFRGASILAVTPNRDSVKAYVYDEERDIFTDIPDTSFGQSNDGASMSVYQRPSNMGIQMDSLQYSGQADQLLGKLIRRMCTIPAIFQYPLCFREPSEGAQSVGYITPGRKQYWMMAPKTFFASRSIRLAFRVEGGRLRVCFGRKPNPDETASKNKDQQQQMYQPQQQQTISFSNNGQQPTDGLPQRQQPIVPVRTTSDDYYTGMEYGVCKDVMPGQEIDFLVSDACAKKSIAECEPFYFVLREISQPGEGDPNYMCRDDGCKRFDQAKFIMTHTGVVCSAAFSLRSSWITIVISTLVASYTIFGDRSVSIPNGKPTSSSLVGLSTKYMLMLVALATTCLLACVQQVNGQLQAGVYDFGEGRYGEKRGNFTPSEWAAIVLIVVLIFGGLALTVALCYYVVKRTQGLTPVSQDES